MRTAFVQCGAALSLTAILLGLGCSSSDPPVAESEQEATHAPLSFPLDRTPERLERGRYLVHSVVLCLDCHSQIDWKNRTTAITAGTAGGGEPFDMEGMPGRVVAPNITPDKKTGAGDWSDEDFFNALTRGIGHDGRTLFPLMPYMNYRAMADEDLASIIVYVRSLDPVEHELPPTELLEPVKASLQPLPPREPAPPSDLSDPVARGAYLANAALCPVCHTPPQPDGAPQTDLLFAGGWRMAGPWGEVAPSNITPDPSGISYYDEALFLNALRTGKVKDSRELSVLMPFRFYKNMTDEDIQALYAFLKTVKPVAHRVDNTEESEPCKRCGFPHGLGGMN